MAVAFLAVLGWRRWWRRSRSVWASRGAGSGAPDPVSDRFAEADRDDRDDAEGCREASRNPEAVRDRRGLCVFDGGLASFAQDTVDHAGGDVGALGLSGRREGRLLDHDDLRVGSDSLGDPRV